MTRFALPYDPDAAPIRDLIGLGFRLAWQPGDYIGPRLDCPMWTAAPDADTPYGGKYDPPLAAIDPYAVGRGFGTVLPAETAAAASASANPVAGTLSGAPVIGPLSPGWPGWLPGPARPCGCGTEAPPPPHPPVAPVPLDPTIAYAATALAALFLLRKGVIAMLREYLARVEGRYVDPAHSDRPQ